MRGRELFGLFAFAVMVATITALGIGARATYGAQTTADEPQYLLSALSLWEDGNLDISDELTDDRYRDFHEADLPQQTRKLEDGRRISPHDPLLPALLAVPVGLGGWVGGKLAMGILGGVLAALVVWAARHRFGVSALTAYLVAGVFALAPPLAVYSTQIYPELPAALGLLAGLAAVLGPFERRGKLVFVLSVIALPWLAVKYVPLAGVLAVAGLVKAGRGRRLPLLAVFGAAAALYVVGHFAIYGDITAYATGDHFVGGQLTAVGTEVNLWGRSTRLIGLLVDRGFGIGAWQPAFLLLPLVAAWAFAGKVSGRVTALWLLAVGWVVATFVALTMHGWWFPGRQLVVVLPVAVLLVASWANESSSRLGLVVAVGATGVLSFVFLLSEGLSGRLTWVVDFGATANPIHRAIAFLLPDYLTPTIFTWFVHGFWVVVAVGLALVGWRSGTSREPSATVAFETRENQERVST